MLSRGSAGYSLHDSSHHHHRIDPGAKDTVAVVRGREVLLLADLPAPEDSTRCLTG